MEEDKTYDQWINEQRENFPYYSPAPKPDEFPIVGSTVIYEANDTYQYTTEEFSRPKEAGFNVLGVGNIVSDQFKANLETAKKSCVRLSIWNDLLKQYKINNIGFLEEGKREWVGILPLQDEPSYLQLIGEDERKYDQEGNPIMNLQEKYRYLMSQDDIWCPVLINLYGGAEKPVLEGNGDGCKDFDPNSKDQKEQEEYNQCKLDKYENYLDKFQKYFKPSVACFDLYPIREFINLIYSGFPDRVKTKHHEGELEISYESFYRDLEFFHQFSYIYNRPFWTYVQSMCMMHAGKNDFFSPVQLEQYFRYEVFTALAYGAKAILYWTYGMRKNGGDEKYFSALLDRRNIETASWYFAQKVNQEVHLYEHIFVMGKNGGLYKGNHPFGIDLSPIFKITIKGDNELLASLFYTEKETYLMVVNCDVLEYQNFKISLTYGKVVELTPITSGGEINTQLKTGITERILPPGGYRIFQLTNLIITRNIIGEGQLIQPINEE